MALQTPELPTRFPCWCRAVFSWGGETKRDLGFVEGDLIECLNAGDGSWWTGRLRRDKRMVGLFPSNFVEVLDETFRPASPLPQRTADLSHISRANSPAPEATKPPQKSVFRKPFQAYVAAGSPNPEASRRDSQRSGTTNHLNSPQGSVKNHRPFSAMKRPLQNTSPSGSIRGQVKPTMFTQGQFDNRSPLRTASPAPPRPQSRAVSPNPHLRHGIHSRATSPRPYDTAAPTSRAHSPMPAVYTDPHFHTRAPSPALFPDNYDSPPPAPPPHRVAYQASRAPSPQAYNAEDYRPASSQPPSPAARSHMTPSPMTAAMNGVMSSLHDMGTGDADVVAAEAQDESEHEIFSPDSFDQIYSASAKSKKQIALNEPAMKHQDSGYGSVDELGEDPGGGLPGMVNYVERMESRLRQMHLEENARHGTMAPPPPSKDAAMMGGAGQPLGSSNEGHNMLQSRPSQKLRSRKSAYELGRAALSRTFTLKSSSTNATDSSGSTNHSLMSGASASAFSATSAGSLARRNYGFAEDVTVPTKAEEVRPASAFNFNHHNTSLVSLARNSDTQDSRSGARSVAGYSNTPAPDRDLGRGVLGGLTTPSPKKRGLFRKLVDTAKTGAASARSTISSSGDLNGRRSQNSRPQSRAQSAMERPRSRFGGFGSISGGVESRANAAREMGLGGDVEWVQVRRDVNRSNSISHNERQERNERAQMQDLPALAPVDIFNHEAEGDEGLDGLPIAEPTDFITGINLALVDKSTRFISNLPMGINVTTLAQSYVCRPYRGDVQRLRAVFTWVSERVGWEEEIETGASHQVDTRRVVQSKRGTSKEIAHLVAEMCTAVGLGAEVVYGYLKTPGEDLAESMEHASNMRPNHWWNAVIVDGEWRIMDTVLANPTYPKRSLYSSCPSSQADGWYFLTRPMEACYTHVPQVEEFQHVVPPIDKRVLLALPTVCPPYFQHGLRLVDYDTSLLFIDSLEMMQVQLDVAEDVECVAELEVREYVKDSDGDYFESGDISRKPALCQAEWLGGTKRWRIKSVLPGDEGRGVLKIYAGKRGLMHSVKSNPHALALALPITHTGTNPPYKFLTRHPTPHAQRHDLYVAQPQCGRLALHNTFVFTIRQHPSSVAGTPNIGPGGFSITRPASSFGASIQRPHSAMSMHSVSVAGSAFTNASNTSDPASTTSQNGSPGAPKPAKLAIQSPSGKILRVVRKNDVGTGSGRELEGDGSTWETVIKVGEKGTWRGLVLADRSARWCVFGEWECY